ncbi:LamG-like jellyroll fold domain-containing protein, partial [Luteolibacter marinus]|uniref:LamG-like jellyroll fold domain-containing protein n=1 Tax=Luteolibacter marinus TaxID=2776705 RepID=UPI001865F75F
PPAPPPAAAISVARLTHDESAIWSSTPVKTGDWLQPGDFELLKGSAEITFDSGTEIRIKAPATLTITSASHALLASGKATVHIPEQAAGFVLETPKATVSEQGTRFGIAVDLLGETEIHVTEGFLELDPKRGDIQPMLIARNQPIRLEEDKLLTAGSTNYRPNEFPSRLPPNPLFNPTGLLHWDFNSASTGEETFRNTGFIGDRETGFPARARSRNKESSHSLVTGRFGNAVKLNGFGAFLDTSFPGIAGSEARSIAFWIKIPPNTPLAHAYAIVSWGDPKATEAGHKWQIGWNTAGDNQGTRGAIRTEAGHAFNVGSTDLRDGRWHHVVSVFHGGKDARVATHIRHYVDGRLESCSASKDAPVDTLVNSPDSFPLTIGRRLESDAIFRTFKGSLDELYIFPVALTPEQIYQLYKHNQIAGPSLSLR